MHRCTNVGCECMRHVREYFLVRNNELVHVKAAASGATGTLNRAKPITDCRRAPLVDDWVAGLKFTDTLRHLWNLFQEVPGRVLRVPWLYVFGFCQATQRRWEKNLI